NIIISAPLKVKNRMAQAWALGLTARCVLFFPLGIVLFIFAWAFLKNPPNPWVFGLSIGLAIIVAGILSWALSWTLMILSWFFTKGVSFLVWLDGWMTGGFLVALHFYHATESGREAWGKVKAITTLVSATFLLRGRETNPRSDDENPS